MSSLAIYPAPFGCPLLGAVASRRLGCHATSPRIARQAGLKHPARALAYHYHLRGLQHASLCDRTHHLHIFGRPPAELVRPGLFGKVSAHFTKRLRTCRRG